MDNTNSKILTFSFATFSLIIGFTMHLLLKAFSGAFGFMAQMYDKDLVKHGLPVATGIILFAVLQFNKQILAWGDEVVTEVRKVVFPSRKDTVGMTIVVLIFVLISSIIVTLFDFGSAWFINTMIK